MAPADKMFWAVDEKHQSGADGGESLTHDMDADNGADNILLATTFTPHDPRTFCIRRLSAWRPPCCHISVTGHNSGSVAGHAYE